MEFVVAVVPVFLASVVECVEAWTIVVAVGLVRGWKAPLLGVLAGMGVIGVLVAIFGVTLVDRIDEHLFQFLVGTLLVLFGLRWLRKAILRYAGLVAIHDEEVVYARQSAELAAAVRTTRFDWLGFVTATKTMLLEGLEIVFLVITLGANGDATYPVAIAGAAVAFVFVGTLGLVAQRPLSKIPENTLKCFVGIMLCAFGTFYVAESYGVDWPGDAWAVVYLLAGWVALTWFAVRSIRAAIARPTLLARQA